MSLTPQEINELKCLAFDCLLIGAAIGLLGYVIYQWATGGNP